MLTGWYFDFATADHCRRSFYQGVYHATDWLAGSVPMDSCVGDICIFWSFAYSKSGGVAIWFVQSYGIVYWRGFVFGSDYCDGLWSGGFDGNSLCHYFV